MWSRQTRLDYYWPALSHIGEQAVLNKKFMLKELLLMRMFLDIKSVMQSIVISLLRLQVYLGQQLLVL